MGFTARLQSQVTSLWQDSFDESVFEIAFAKRSLFREGSLTHIALLCISSAVKLAKDLVAASSVPLILSILGEGESYGYAIIQRVHELSDGQIEWSDGMLYPVLHWLEEQGHVKARWDKSETGRRRKYYSLKQEGRRALAEHQRQWLTVHTTLQSLWRPQHV
jgi:PadR family transcriptional regulator, regulatory protein PadR